MILNARSSRASRVVPLAAGAVVSLAPACTIDFDANFAGSDGCANGRCVAAPPNGWKGPVVFGDASGACPAGWTSELSAPTCSACTCDGSASCSSAELQFGEGACQGGDNAQPSANQCSSFDVSGGLDSVSAQPGAPTGTCTPSTSQQSSATLCSASSGGGCDGGTVCAPHGGAQACIYAPGSLTCPAPYDAARSILAPMAGAAITCSACACGAPAGTCAGQTHVYSNSGCSGSDVLVQNDGSCTSIGFSPQSARYEPQASQVSCAPSGGEPMPANPAGAITVCCAPAGS